MLSRYPTDRLLALASSELLLVEDGSPRDAVADTAPLAWSSECYKSPSRHRAHPTTNSSTFVLLVWLSLPLSVAPQAAFAPRSGGG